MAAECGIGVGTSIATEVAKSLYRTVKQEIFYMFKYQSYVNDLNGRVQQLGHKREREQLRVDYATRQGDEIHKDVEEWLTEVNEFINQVANPNSPGDEGREKIPCFNLTTRYKVGKKAVKAAKEGSNLLGKEFKDIAHRPGPQRSASMYVRDYEAFDSRESILQQIMDALKDANINSIGVEGLGGVGKTTLVKKVAWQAMEDKLFDDVVMAEVTQKPDYKKIQEKIACDLGLEFGQHETEFERAQRLRNRLKKGKRVLVILDDIWAKPDLEAIGIPLGNDHEERDALQTEHCKRIDDKKGDAHALRKEDCKGIEDDQSKRLYKILLTSRSRDLLCNDMNTGKNFNIQSLSENEARNLFWKIVGDDSVKVSDFSTIGEEMVEKCAGLPVAIATIANALKNRSIHAWKDALDKLRTSNPRSIPEMDERVVSVIELSFNLLQSDEAKKLFLLCCLVDYGHGTSYDDLLRYGMGWGLFQNVYTMENGRKRLHILIDNLKASRLLLEGLTNSWVKMHEFIHAVAISIASRNNLMFNIQDVSDLNKVLEEKRSENPTAISLLHRDICELPESLGLPKLKLFFMFMNSPSLQIPNAFFDVTKELKVIDFTGINLQSLPSSFGCLTNVQTLCLDECLLGDISAIGELKNLEILSLSRSSIEKLPKEIGKLTRLKLLDLSRCPKLKLIAPNVISRLTRLEELYLNESFIQWENGFDNQNDSKGNDVYELNQLSRLTTLNICIPDAQIIPPDLPFQQLERYTILIGDEWNWSHRNEASRTLKLKLNNSSYLAYKAINKLLKRTEDLFLDEFKDVQNVLYELDEEGFPDLKYLHVQNGSDLVYIVNSAGRIHSNAFLMLESLSLNSLINLKQICHGPTVEASFNKLRTVKVNKCDNLEHLFSTSMAKSLSQLQEIEVTDCENLKVIFSEEDDEGCVHDSQIKLAQLRSLILQRLPQFTSFSFNVMISQTVFASNIASTEITTKNYHEDFKTLLGRKVEYPSLENLKLSSIGIEKIWPEQLLQTASYCQTVKSLTLEGCNGLKFLLSASMVKSFVQLQLLEICKCESMEEVIDTKCLEGEECISFPNLVFLELKDLPRLNRFGNGNNIIEFPSMNVLIIENCPNLRTFFSNNTCTDMTVTNEAEADKQPLFGDKVGLPSLEVLVVYQMNNLRKIWNNRPCSEFFGKIKILKLKDCNKLLNIFPSEMLERLQTLEDLEVINCDSLEEIFELQAFSGQTTPAIAATQLRVLNLCLLPNLKHVWNMDAKAILAYENLIKMRVYSCPSLKSLFQATIANGLHKLEEIEISTCLLEEIIAKDDKVEEAAIPWFRFPRLTSLSLHCLPELKTFYPERHISDWPVLKKMEVSGCKTGCGDVKILVSELQSQLDRLQPLFLVDKVAFPKLEELRLSYLPELLHLWGDTSQSSRVFQNLVTLELSVCEKLKTLVPSSVFLWNLKTLDVSKCNGLISLMTLPTAKSLVNLTRINIADCKMIEEIITHVGDKANDDQIVFRKLKYLRLHHLPILTRFCSFRNYSMKFPSLEKAIVGHCPKMVMLEKVDLKQGDDQGHWQDNLDTTRQQLFKEMVGFQGLKFLKVSEFPQLEQIWQDKLLPGRFFCNLTSLVLDKCSDIRSAIPVNLLGFLNNLEMLEIRNCGSIEQVFDEELSVDQHLSLLSQLNHFYLINMPKLSYICRRSHQRFLGFKNLKFLEVQNCGYLRYIFTASIFSGLKQLQAMKVIDCATMEAIITKEEEEEAADKIVLPQLKSIVLESLPDLTSFYSGSNILECPSLEAITITNCTKMKAFVFANRKDLHLRIPPFFSDKVVLPALEELKLSSIGTEMVCHNKLLATSSFQNLTILYLHGFDNLRYLFPSRMVKSLVLLQQLMISRCKSLEVAIFTEEDTMNEMMMFPRLNLLKLEYLPSLKMFCNYTGNLIKFPLLSNLFIDNCVSMETFISNSISPIDDGSVENHPDNMQPLFDEKVSLPNLEKLIVWKMDSLRRIWDNNQLNLDSFSKLHDMRVEYCHQLLNIFPSIMHGRLQSLEVLKVGNCDSVKEIFKFQSLSGPETNAVIATQLRVLHLHHLPNLKYVCDAHNQEKIRRDDQLNLHSFSKLHEMRVGHCNKLLNIFPSIMRGRLQSLQVLMVWNCDSVEEIFNFQTLSCRETNVVVATPLRKLQLHHLQNLKHVCNMHKEQEVIAVQMFRQLTSLTLKDLPRLGCFYSGIHISEWPVLQHLVVDECTKVETLASKFLSPTENHEQSRHPLFLVDKVAFPSLEELTLSKLPELLHLWKENSQPNEVFQNLATLTVFECNKLRNMVPSSVSFHNLRTMEVSNCDRLISLMASPTVRSLVQLTRMNVSGCKIIEEIMTVTDSEDDEKYEIVFKELKYLGLQCLPCLRSFCLKNCTLEFPSLDQVIVRECPYMETFFPGILSTPKLQKLQLTEGEDGGHWEGNLNTTLQQMFKKNAQFEVIRRILKHFNINHTLIGIKQVNFLRLNHEELWIPVL